MTQPLRMLNTWDTTTLQRQYFHFFQMNLFDNLVFFQLCYRLDRPKVMHKVGQCVPGENEQFFPCRHVKVGFFVVVQLGSMLVVSSNLGLCCCHPIWDLNVVLLKFNLFLKGDSHGWKGLKSCKELRNEIGVKNYFASKD